MLSSLSHLRSILFKLSENREINVKKKGVQNKLYALLLIQEKYLRKHVLTLPTTDINSLVSVHLFSLHLPHTDGIYFRLFL